MTDQPNIPDRQAAVSLREINKHTVRAIIKLKVAPEQERFVANNAVSLAEALFEPQAWYRAIYAGETPVGFIMLYDNRDEAKYHLWRFMIAAPFQGRGFGRQAFQHLLDYVRTRPGAAELLVSYVPGEGSPEPFYLKLGFKNTGEIHDGEHVMKRQL